MPPRDPAAPIRVLIVDDSPVVRRMLASGLSKDPGILVVGEAGDPFEARDQIVKLRPEVLTMDVEMPRMNGVEFVRRLMPQYPLPIIMVSSLTEEGQRVTLDALEAGALDFVTKPTSRNNLPWPEVLADLIAKIKVGVGANLRRLPAVTAPTAAATTTAASATAPAIKPAAGTVPGIYQKHLLAIGASTGGTDAVRIVLEGLPADSPGVVVTQHMPPNFTAMFAERLNKLLPLTVKEAANGDAVLAGTVLIAPGGKQMRVVKRGGQYHVVVEDGEKVSGHCPSVDVLLRSVASAAGGDAVGVILTGMGRDGADGMLQMRQAGGRTLAQDEATSVVWGMPGEATKNGGAEKTMPLGEIARAMTRLAKGASA